MIIGSFLRRWKRLHGEAARSLRSQKKSEIIDINPNVLMLLPRLGIPLGFGEETVKLVCDRQDVPPEFFILLCNVYSFDYYIPSEKEIASINMKMLLPYLQSSHSYYLDEKLLISKNIFHE